MKRIAAGQLIITAPFTFLKKAQQFSFHPSQLHSTGRSSMYTRTMILKKRTASILLTACRLQHTLLSRIISGQWGITGTIQKTQEHGDLFLMTISSASHYLSGSQPRMEISVTVSIGTGYSPLLIKWIEFQSTSRVTLGLLERTF